MWFLQAKSKASQHRFRRPEVQTPEANDKSPLPTITIGWNDYTSLEYSNSVEVEKNMFYQGYPTRQIRERESHPKYKIKNRTKVYLEHPGKPQDVRFLV